jgi:hypothetical protein
MPARERQRASNVPLYFRSGDLSSRTERCAAQDAEKSQLLSLAGARASRLGLR